MTLVRRPSPFGELLSLRQAMDRFFEDGLVRPASLRGPVDRAAFPLDVSTTSDALVIEAALPGARPEDVEVTVENRMLTICGTSATRREPEAEGDYLVREIRRGEFNRALRLPAGFEPDRAEATFDDGLLTVRIPRAEQLQPRRIQINATGNGQPNSATAEDSAGAPAGA